MKVTIIDQTDNIVSLEIDESEIVSTLMELIAIEFNIKVEEQVLQFAGKQLISNQTIQQTGLKNEDMIQVSKKFVMPQQQFGNNNNNNNNNNQLLQQNLQAALSGIFGNQQNNNNGNNNNQIGNMFDPLNNPRIIDQAQKMKAHYETHPDELNMILHQNREFAEAILSNNIKDLCAIIYKKEQEQVQKNQQRNKRLMELQMDPMNPDNQREIEKIINEQNIENQRDLAYEQHPEFFVQISMLYIEISLNGNPVQAFVDSGAQMTIMSKQLAEKCGLMRLIDTKCAGMALGVGSARILGKIHLAQMQIADKKIPVSLSILEDDKLQFLLGLDTLKRYQCLMDLGERNLTFKIGGEKVTVPFLRDDQIQKTISISQEQKMLEDEKKIQKMEEEEGQEKQKGNNNQKFPQESIDVLVGLGATQEEAFQALTQCQGNVEYAANIITQKKFGN